MHCATLKTSPFHGRFPSQLTFPNYKNWTQFKPRNKTHKQSSLNSPKHVRISDSNLHSSPSSLVQNTHPPNPNSLLFCSSVTAKKLRFLVSEFKSLPKPIDRVKRLLHYAALLPVFDDSAQVESNRVRGCTTQVWLESRMDSEGLMRFGAYSDSEITKGFCSCLIWVLDGASPEEVAAVAADDLVDLNVGISGRAHSRVNTWHNVLMGMQKRTRDLVEERERVPRSENFPAMVVAVDGQSANTTYAETKERLCSPGLAH
ncbi:SufE-like protein [Actinidia chinensis var. chinensis]|uniref:SufE-like protein n=1 Tax=Actinidia chinensis var. chinensis TaxID=1590841 RepID=A0A2R6REV6_ACTCC|nr:SufE-like protein [Actinidia chinensis var. chinensis]